MKINIKNIKLDKDNNYIFFNLYCDKFKLTENFYPVFKIKVLNVLSDKIEDSILSAAENIAKKIIDKENGLNDILNSFLKLNFKKEKKIILHKIEDSVDNYNNELINNVIKIENTKYLIQIK
jgi:hypothetical protein